MLEDFGQAQCEGFWARFRRTRDRYCSSRNCDYNEEDYYRYSETGLKMRCGTQSAFRQVSVEAQEHMMYTRGRDTWTIPKAFVHVVLDIGILNSLTSIWSRAWWNAVTTGITGLSNSNKDHPSTEAHHKVRTTHPPYQPPHPRLLHPTQTRRSNTIIPRLVTLSLLLGYFSLRLHRRAEWL